MSLEATLFQTNELLSKLLVVLTTGMEAEANLGSAEAAKPKRGRPAKSTEAPAPAAETPAAAPAVAAQADTPAVVPADAPWGLVDGDPIDTRYFLIAAHNTVIRQLPGEPLPSIGGAERVTAQVYLAKKAEFAALTQSILAAQKAPAPVAEPAPVAAPVAEPVAEPAPVAAPVAEPAPAPAAEGEVPFSHVVGKLQLVLASNKPGHGREGVLSILKRFLPDDPAPTVPKLSGIGRNAEVLAAAQALLTPADDLGL